MANTPDTTPIQNNSATHLELGEPVPEHTVPVDPNQKGGFDHSAWANQTPAERTATQEGVALIRATLAASKAKQGQ